MLKYSTPLSLDQTPKERKREKETNIPGTGKNGGLGRGKNSLQMISDWVRVCPFCPIGTRHFGWFL